MGRFFLSLFLGCFLAGISVASVRQDPDPPLEQAPDKGDEQSIPIAELPWQVKLGIRSALLSERTPVLDRVVLVPDLATWLDEVARWRLRARWPVLIEDDLYTPLFIRGFKPKQVVRRAPVEKPLPESAAELEARAKEIALGVWGSDGLEPEETIENVYQRLGWIPQGIVATSFTDPAWPAALALAIGRGELLRKLDGDFGVANDTLGVDAVARIENAVEGMFSGSGLTWETLGDDLDAFTICRELAVRVQVPMPASMRMEVSGRGRIPVDPLVSLTDFICRNVDGSRFAICGWIWGDRERSIYMAMCSLFLDRDSVLLVNAYGSTGTWRSYEITDPGGMLETVGFDVRGIREGENATIAAWRLLVMGGVDADVLIFNTSGAESVMNLSKSTTGTTHDIPALSRPLALHMIHSFSLHSPGDKRTIGGRWLSRGVYAYVGSCEEPFLHAFVPPKALVKRIVNFVPFLVASRLGTGEMSKPWRLVTIGDPLMLIEPPPKRHRKRIEIAVPLEPGDVDLRAMVSARLRQEGQPADAWVLRDLQLLSQDVLARKLWDRSLEHSPTSEQASAILPLLFQQRDASSFLTAYRLAGEPEGEAREMLWTLFLPRLKRFRSVSELSTLVRSLRRGLAAEDLRELLPVVESLQGRGQRQQAIARALEQAKGACDRRRLRELLANEDR